MVAVVLINPKFPHNVGGAVRACAAFGVDVLRWSGTRVIARQVPRHMKTDRVPPGGMLEYKVANQWKTRLPREERLRAFRTVDWGWATLPLWGSAADGAAMRLSELDGLIPVAVEYREAAEDLAWFDHPKDAVYVFGPEDGSLDKGTLSACHRFVRIPSDVCLNLAAAVNVVLADRRMKEVRGNG